ncbi:GcrA family cell cycle regulator [Sinorhizobium medicae]|uniref:GcrA family cell cycle regulator n=1 Tax=Sinorhizobium medicae TaxID=110321 RepID=UPI000C7C897E|nr:GcrA family cell cycle regulator [Sinorhizobium medicae]PLU28274.1 global cell cycle regulator GcrA [Sinorhizobium medicae]PLU37767.1 global cell cycle regulator GcrA [Sinorhizobium medicae]PLU43978.1 global cell cycle regulator GcrA [Sinorhizobium medicae]PLU47487.1 global cell cycle regulator GcrA [Sinorhizobium medicae]PLU67377.1 global cell cycle regulator GcrA [Sinorhizobium medicae]
MQPEKVIWKEADRDKVAEMLKKGLSAAKIGQAMGISRGAAIGRIFRNDRLRTLMKRPPKAASPRRWPVKKGARSTGKENPAPVLQLPPPPMRLVPLVELKRGDCHWPASPHGAAPDQHLFCGAGTRKGEKWCPYHQLIGYQPRAPRHG